MNYLLDTHTGIRAISEQASLSNKVKKILQNNDNRFWFSQISLFEIAIKKKTKRIEEFNIDFDEFIESIYTSGFNMLEVKNEHFQTYNQIEFPDFHRDPI